MFTNFYCIVSSAAWISKVPGVGGDYLKVYDVVHSSAAFDILSRGADKNGIVVDRSKGFAHYFRPLVGDVIRPSSSYYGYGANGADIEVEVYRWTGDEATTTNFKPVKVVTLSFDYPHRGAGQGLGFGTDDQLIVLKDAFPEHHAGPVYGPTTEELTGKQKELAGKQKRKHDLRKEAQRLYEEAQSLQDAADLDPRFFRFKRR